ncbi:EamA family transporter, partial [Cetobacterium sp.]|uniref:EamA family transporter n=1 Tax=Cetobacterium sp. TaxID=2071632 RepID=UPI002FCA3F03
CYSIQTFAQKDIEPSKVSLILTTEIIFGAIFSVLILGDKLNLQLVLGGLLIFLSIILTELKKVKIGG